MLSVIEKVVYYYKDASPDDNKEGENFKICCPFHNETNPSCWIQPEKEMFYCFGCGEGSSVYDYIILKEEYDSVKDDKRAFFLAKKKLQEILDVPESEIEHVIKRREEEVERKPLTPLDPKILKDFKRDKTDYPKSYRSVREDVLKFYDHLFKLNPDGSVKAVYYPETTSHTVKTAEGKKVTGNVITGYKCRNHPKDFRYGKIGTTGSKCQLSGQHKFKGTKTKLLITSGEEDKVSAYQMFKDRMDDQHDGDYEPIHVVSGTTGETSLATQLKINMDFLMSYKEIYIGLDNDAPGIAATKTAVEAFPAEFRSNLKVVTWSMKDPNEMLQAGKVKQFFSDFWNAKSYVPDGIKTSVDADVGIEELLLRPRIPLPSFLPKKARKMLKEHLPLGIIVNIIAESSAGKTTFLRALTDHWIFHSPYKCGIVSLEETAEQYQMGLLSSKLRVSLDGFENANDAIAYLRKPEVVEVRENLRVNDFGESRYHIIDDRDGTIAGIIHQCEILIRVYGCKLIIIDPLQDLTDGMSNEEQQKLVKWEKQVVKDGVTIVNICHIRKGNHGATLTKDGKRTKRIVTEDDVAGTSTIVKSGAVNMILERDKFAEDELERNRTYLTISKNRHGKLTGEAGSMAYNGVSLEDFDDYCERMYNGNTIDYAEKETVEVEQKEKPYVVTQEESVEIAKKIEYTAEDILSAMSGVVDNNLSSTQETIQEYEKEVDVFDIGD